MKKYSLVAILRYFFGQLSKVEENKEIERRLKEGAGVKNRGWGVNCVC